MRKMSDFLIYAPLYRILLGSNAVVGATWAWRVTRLVHAIPFWLTAFGFGWFAGWAWDVPGIKPVRIAWGSAGFVALLTAKDWFKEWRRGY